jgi:hypothetical protein
MIAKDIIDEVRDLLSDADEIAYQPDALLQNLNSAIYLLNRFLINANSSEMIKELAITNEMAVPADFANRYAGTYPVCISDGKFQILDDSPTMTVRYYAVKPLVSSASSTVAFPDSYRPVLTQATAIYALNGNEYDISQDKGLLNDLLAVTK